MTSEFTGPRATELEPVEHNADGNRRGEIAASTSRQNTAAIAKWLAAHTPRDADKALASLALSHGVNFRVEREITFSRLGPNGEHIPAREPAIKAIHVDGEYSEELADRVQGFLTPAPRDQIERWLAELSVIAAKRADDDLSEELRLAAYTNRLMDYPADMVRQVLVVKRWKFFPTWFELAEILDKMNVERGRVVSVLSRPWATKRAEEHRPGPAANVVKADPQHVKDVLAQMEAKLRDRGEWSEAAE